MENNRLSLFHPETYPLDISRHLDIQNNSELRKILDVFLKPIPFSSTLGRQES